MSLKQIIRRWLDVPDAAPARLSHEDKEALFYDLQKRLQTDVYIAVCAMFDPSGPDLEANVRASVLHTARKHMHEKMRQITHRRVLEALDDVPALQKALRQVQVEREDFLDALVDRLQRKQLPR
jgi:hypothetical protein